MYWPPRDSYPYDEPFRSERDLERLRHLVFLDGRLIDVWTQPVERTVYRSIAEEFDREKRVPHYEPSEPLPPPYERVLTWLDSVVGGRVALLALDDEPLPEIPAPTVDDTVDELIVRVADTYFGHEFLAAVRAALATVRMADTDLPAQATAGEIAAGLCWLVGRANGLVGAGTDVTQKALKETLWLGTAPTRRASRLKMCLRDLSAPHCVRPSDCPELLELGVPTYLTSATRRRLIVLRDRAVTAAERAEADQRAREALMTGRVANLTS